MSFMNLESPESKTCCVQHSTVIFYERFFAIMMKWLTQNVK